MGSQQLLRKPGIYPANDILAQALGDAYDAYEKFAGGLENHDIELEWRYYTDGKAWLAKGLYTRTGPHGGQNKTTAFWLSIWDGFFKVTIYVAEKDRAGALSLPLDDEGKRMIADAKQMGKTKVFPLVFELRSEEMLEAVYTLADFRKASGSVK